MWVAVNLRRAQCVGAFMKLCRVSKIPDKLKSLRRVSSVRVAETSQLFSAVTSLLSFLFPPLKSCHFSFVCWLSGGEGGRSRRAAGCSLYGRRRYGAVYQRCLRSAVAVGTLLPLGLLRRQTVPEQTGPSRPRPSRPAGHVWGAGTKQSTAELSVTIVCLSCPKIPVGGWIMVQSAYSSVCKWLLKCTFSTFTHNLRNL